MAKTRALSRQTLKNRTKFEKILLVLLLIIAYLLLASLFKWWPLNVQRAELGTAFYVGQGRTVITESTSDTAAGINQTGGGSGGGGNGSGGSNNGGGGDTNNPPSSSSTSPLLSFAATVDRGDSKEQISGQAGGLNESCAIVLNSSTAGKQEVCVYSEGDKIVTVTYLNDRVISASRSGF